MADQKMNIIVSANVAQAQDAFNALNKTMANTAAVGQKTTKDFTGLSRVLQDLPFGFIAISNNLTQLLPAAGGLGLAFSALVSALTFAKTGLSNWTRGLQSSKDQLSLNTKAQQEYQKALESSYESAGKQLAQVSKLVEQAKLDITTKEQQKKIVQELNSISNEYFGSLRVENGLVVGLTDAYNNYANNILKVARAKAAIETTEKLTAELLKVKDAGSSIDNTFSNLALNFRQVSSLIAGQGGSAFDKIAAANEKISAILKKEVPTLEEVEFLTKITGFSVQEVNDRLAKRGAYHTEEAKLLARIADLSKTIAIADGTQASNTDKKVKSLKVLDESLKIKPVADLFDGPIDFGRGINIQSQLQKKLDKMQPLKFPPFDEGELAKRVAQMADIITNTLSNSFEAIGNAIGDTVSGKGNPFSGIFKVLGEGLQQLGKYVILSSTLIATVKKALNAALGPAGAALGIAAGIGLIALGRLMQNIPKFATGGIVTKPTLALIGEQGPERVTPLGYSQSSSSNNVSGEVVFTIRGETLRGVLQRANNTSYNTN